MNHHQLRDDGMAVVQNDPFDGMSNAALDRLATKSEGRGFKFELIENFANRTTIKKPWLIKGIIAAGETSAWVGPPGSLKSALMAELSICAANRIDWHGKKTMACFGVLYFALERADLVRRRLSAHWKRLGLGENDLQSIAVVPATVDLMNPATVPKIIETINSAAACFGQPVKLVIFDTFAKLVAAGGGDEDKARDQGRVFSNIQRIKEGVSSPIHAALVGHTGKDETRGSRGSNAILGDVDVMVTIGGSEIKTATVAKANDMPEGPLFSFKSDVHEFGLDEDGDPITVNIVSADELSPQDAAKPTEPKLSTNQRVMYRLLVEAGAAGLTVEAWNDLAKENGITTKQRHYEIRMALKDKGLVREHAGVWRING